jgi:hypothetical protein
MKIKYMLITGISILTLATSTLYPRCNCPTWYKGFYTYKVYLTKPTNSPTDFYCVLTKNRHGLYGGQPQRRYDNEPLTLFSTIASTDHIDKQCHAFVHYNDLMSAIDSDQPAHNVRVRAQDSLITLSKPLVRDLREGIARQTLETHIKKSL